jgi:ABC-type amino acid transport substrate-binding protein
LSFPFGKRTFFQKKMHEVFIMKKEYLLAGGTIFISVVLSVIISLATAPEPPKSQDTAPKHTDSLRQTVLDRGVLRCGYFAESPNFMPKSGRTGFEGISHDVVFLLMSAINVKVDWAEEVSFDTMIEGLQNGRYDAVCSGVWPNAWRAKTVDFSMPYYYTAVGAYVRADDPRFDQDLSAINSRDVRISVIDGEMAQFIAAEDFPKAAWYSLPPMSSPTESLLGVATRKADVAFVLTPLGDAVMARENLKNAAVQKPWRVFGNTIMFRPGEADFKNMVDTLIRENLQNGRIDQILDSYEKTPGAFKRVLLPYR